MKNHDSIFQQFQRFRAEAKKIPKEIKLRDNETKSIFRTFVFLIFDSILQFVSRACKYPRTERQKEGKRQIPTGTGSAHIHTYTYICAFSDANYAGCTIIIASCRRGSAPTTTSCIWINGEQASSPLDRTCIIPILNRERLVIAKIAVLSCHTRHRNRLRTSVLRSQITGIQIQFSRELIFLIMQI